MRLKNVRLNYVSIKCESNKSEVKNNVRLKNVKVKYEKKI